MPIQLSFFLPIHLFLFRSQVTKNVNWAKIWTFIFFFADSPKCEPRQDLDLSFLFYKASLSRCQVIFSFRWFTKDPPELRFWWKRKDFCAVVFARFGLQFSRSANSPFFFFRWRTKNPPELYFEFDGKEGTFWPLFLFFSSVWWNKCRVREWGPVVQWLVQRFRSERLRLDPDDRRLSRRRPMHVRRQSLPVWPREIPLPLVLKSGSPLVSSRVDDLRSGAQGDFLNSYI